MTLLHNYDKINLAMLTMLGGVKIRSQNWSKVKGQRLLGIGNVEM